MCVSEGELIRMKLHLITRRYYPGIRYQEEALGQIAEELGIRSETQVRDLSPGEQAEVASRVYDRLPAPGQADAPAAAGTQGDKALA